MDSVSKAVTRSVLIALLIAGFGSHTAVQAADPLDDMTTDRWEKLRERERYQLNIAEDLYRKKNYKVAADEYEKYVKLYERSEAGSFAQLKWSHCLVFERRQVDAIKEGYKVVIENFPDSPEAPLAALLIGRTFKDMGDTKEAKKYYAKTIAEYPKHFVAAMARLDLVEIATAQKDMTRRGELLRELTYDTERKGPTAKECVKASRLFAQHCFANGEFDEGVKALATSCTDDALAGQIMDRLHGNLGQTLQTLATSKDMTEKQRSEKLADAAVAWLKSKAAALEGDATKKALATEYWFIAAAVQGSAHRPEKQREILEQMLTTFGASDALLARIAQWYKDNNQRDRARETYAKFADAIDGQSQVANSFVEEEKFDRAIEIYRTLSVKDDKNAPKWMAQIAYTYRRANKPDLAIAIYRDLLATDSAHAANWQWETAETLFHAGRWKDAITNYRGTDRFPTNYDRMATCFRRLSEWDEAIRLYRQIIAASPPHAAGALLDIAQTEEQASRKDAAIATFKQVCDRYPDTGEGSRANAHLNTKYGIIVTKGGVKK